MKQIWLVDVDGTVIDKGKMWEQLEVIFHKTFPNIKVNFKKYYETHRGKLHLVDGVMQAMKKEYGVEETQFKSMFEAVNYKACFDQEGWFRLKEQADKDGAVLVFFTQGTRWVQEAKQRQIKLLTGKVPWHIYEDNKMDQLAQLMAKYQQEGLKVSRLIDDWEVNRSRAEQEFGLKAMRRL